jgi:hypothetical protein
MSLRGRDVEISPIGVGSFSWKIFFSCIFLFNP